MNTNIQKLTTEQRNDKSMGLDRLSVSEIIELMNEEDRTVAESVGNSLPQIEQAIEAIVTALQQGGRLWYIGAGTSGRMGILDAAECPPTFGVEPDLVSAIIAGGQEAIRSAVENAEDDEEAGRQAVLNVLTSKDVLVGIAASGRTPYVLGAVQAARSVGAVTVGLACNTGTLLGQAVHHPIEIYVGPEVLAGSTRLKAGTAQKMTLNMISTATMIRLGKVFGNLMVNVQATNQKLRDRVVHIIAEATGVDQATAQTYSDLAGGDARLAILMLKYKADYEEAHQALLDAKEHFGEAASRLACKKSC